MTSKLKAVADLTKRLLCAFRFRPLIVGMLDSKGPEKLGPSSGSFPRRTMGSVQPQQVPHTTLNPVVESAQQLHEELGLVHLNPQGIASAAQYIHRRIVADSYSPLTWRTQPLHLCPPVPYSPTHPGTRASMDWVFLVSALNFSFWSELGDEGVYGVEWRKGWQMEGRKIWTGYWSLLASLNKALENGVPITTPEFYSSPTRCPDTLISQVFQPHELSKEKIPLLDERIRIMREVGTTLCSKYDGSFQNFISSFVQRYENKGTAVQLVQMVIDTFPSFRDEVEFNGRKVCFWKRAQILVAESWAAFYPPPLSDSTDHINPHNPHPFLPAGISDLTMFADYRVPQILHHLSVFSYSPDLLGLLQEGKALEYGSKEEMAIRSAGILGVERVRDEINRVRSEIREQEGIAVEDAKGTGLEELSSVLIDFYLWDLAKSIEMGIESVEGTGTNKMVPAHRTRSIWY